MYLMYVDESGDIGLKKSKTKFFILSAIIIHELLWNDTLEDLIEFRRNLRDKKKLKLREEIHCSAFLNKPGNLIRIPMYERVDIIKQCAKWLNNKIYISTFSIRIDKQQEKYNSKDNVFETAWKFLIQRFENTINKHNFNGPSNYDERGIIIADNTDIPKLRTIYRKMRRKNFIPNKKEVCSEGYREIPIKLIVEDPVHRDSRDTYFLQMADVVAYLAYQKYQANKRAKSKGLHKYYERMQNIIIKNVTKYNDYGIVEV